MPYWHYDCAEGRTTMWQNIKPITLREAVVVVVIAMVVTGLQAF